MTPIDDDRPTIDDCLLDELVDGALGETDRRELLGRLDHEPDGWRRCAMAFLEAQCWRETFRAIPTERAAASAAAPSPPPVPRRAAWPGYLTTILAMAASFLLALGLSWLVRLGWIDRGPQPDSRPPLVATSENPAEPAPPAAAVPPVPVPTPWEQKTPWEPKSDAWQTVSVPVSNRESVEWPATEQKNLDDGRIFSPAIPADVLESLHRSGHQVEVERRLVPFPLKDGRKLVIPMDQVDVHYVGHRAYQ
jgi:hypothetical protein